MANRFQTPDEQFVDAEGVPYSGGKLYFYASGTSSPLDTYSDDDLTIPNTNPVILDERGAAGNIFLQPLEYKVVFLDANDVEIFSADPVTSGCLDCISTGGGNLTGTLNFIMGEAIGAAPVTSIWALTDGNSRHVTGNGVDITSLGEMIQAGQQQTLIFDGSVTLKNGADIIMPNGADYTTSAGDVFTFITDAGSVARVLSYSLANGKSLAEAGSGGGTSSGAVVVKTDSYTVLPADANNTLVLNAASGKTFTLPSAATAGNPFKNGYQDTGAGGLTLAAVGSDKILSGGQQLASILLNTGDSGNLIGDGGSPGLWRWTGTRHYDSGPQTITSAGTLTLNHGLGLIPHAYRFALRCLTAQAGYAVGDEVAIDVEIINTTDIAGVSVKESSTALTVRYSSLASVFTVPHATTGAMTQLTNASWAFIVRAMVFN